MLYWPDFSCTSYKIKYKKWTKERENCLLQVQESTYTNIHYNTIRHLWDRFQQMYRGPRTYTLRNINKWKVQIIGNEPKNYNAP